MEKGEERKPIEAERGNEIETNEIASKKTFTLSRLVSSPLSVGNFSPPDEDADLNRGSVISLENVKSGAKSWETKAKQTEINCTGNAFRLQMIIRDPSGSACLRFSANRRACRSPVTPYTPSTR